MAIDPSTGAVFVAPRLLVAGVRPADTVLSPDGLKLYAAGTDGHIRVYHAETGEQIADWVVGKQLGGIDMSPDGKFLVVAERKPVSENLSPDGWPDDERVIAVYRVDAASGQVKSFPTTVTAESYAFFDVAVMSDQTVLVSQSIRPGWSSGFVYPLRLLNLKTGAYSAVAQVRQDTFLSDSLAGTRALFAEGNTNSEEIGVYARPGGVIAHGGASPHEVNKGVQAYNAQANLAAQHNELDIHIYDASLGYRLSLSSKYPTWDFYHTMSGLAFDPAGKFLFILNVAEDAIVQLSTADWTIVQTLAIGSDISSRLGGFVTNGGFGSTLLVGADLRFFTIITDQGLFRIDNPQAADALAGTAAADSITGTGVADTLIGYGGNDRLDGRGGADRMIGGIGNDTYVIDNAGDQIVETDTSGSIDTARASVSYALGSGVRVETLCTTVNAGTAAINLTGNEFGQSISGNDGANTMLGKGGADTMNGRGGNDTLKGDGDVAASGDGNDNIRGGAGSDFIYGGRGNDILRGDDSATQHGLDRFYFDTAPNAASNRDSILDFNPADDGIYLKKSGVFAGIATLGTLKAGAFHRIDNYDPANPGARTTTTADDRIIYDQVSGKLYYDADGAGGSAVGVHFATVSNGAAHPTLTNADFIVF